MGIETYPLSSLVPEVDYLPLRSGRVTKSPLEFVGSDGVATGSQPYTSIVPGLVNAFSAPGQNGAEFQWGHHGYAAWCISTRSSNTASWIFSNLSGNFVNYLSFDHANNMVQALTRWHMSGAAFDNGDSAIYGGFNGTGGSGQGNYKGGALRVGSGVNAFHTVWDGTMRFIIDGTNVKNFVIPHPDDDERWLIHACLEGPEAAVFYRGRGQLNAEGNCWVELPDYFTSLVDEATATVQVTPILRDRDVEAMVPGFLGAWETDRLDRASDDPNDVSYRPEVPANHVGVPYMAATEVRDGAFIVVSAGGFVNPEAEFFYEVKATRRDVDPIEVEPLRSEVDVYGDGPYTWYRRKVAA